MLLLCMEKMQAAKVPTGYRFLGKPWQTLANLGNKKSATLKTKMPKRIYDKNGKYVGSVESDEEARKRKEAWDEVTDKVAADREKWRAEHDAKLAAMSPEERAAYNAKLDAANERESQRIQKERQERKKQKRSREWDQWKDKVQGCGCLIVVIIIAILLLSFAVA